MALADLDHGLELQRRGLAAFVRILGGRSEGGAVFEREGVVAAVVPLAPQRSVVNSVVYERAEQLGAALDDLRRAYEEAGVRAWTAWVPEHDGDAVGLLERAGHRFDAEPAAMVLDLARLPELRLDGLDWDGEADPLVVARVNDRAYGMDDDFVRAIGPRPAEPPLRLYQARVEGVPASVAGTFDVGGDCVVLFVATLKEHRGRGLSRRLLHAALSEARERGLRTSTLQATSMGQPVYEALGYRAICRLLMYERRRGA